VSERLPTKKPPSKSQGAVELVTTILEGYAAKAVFRGFSAHPAAKGHASYRMVWHHDRAFELLLDVGQKTLQFPEVLPGVPARSPMYRELQAFLKVRQSDELPEHRRVNPTKARLASGNKRGTVSITVTVKDGDFDYATRKIIHIVHEIFLIFLVDGPYFEYMVEHLGLDPDRY
jgi:hypothetical protein